jgi:phenylpropionate dioxygenase-like ring-hydroxylating dioxygenase large terminal subunit
MTPSNAEASKGHRWLAQYPELGTEPLSVEPILSQEAFEKQRDFVFKRTWLHVGRVDRIPKKGDYFVARVDVAKAAVIIVRQANGEIGAFHNVCLHRGNKLVWKEAGSCGRYLTCNFHGWVFDTYGNVASIPDVENFYDLDRSKLSLRQVRVAVWEGFIFINLDESDTETLEEFLGEVVERVRGYPFDMLPTRSHWTTDVKCNWQLIGDGQAEAYHVPYLHANSVQGLFTGQNNPHTHLLNFEALGLHWTESLPFDPDAVPDGIQPLMFQYGSSLIQTKETGTYELPPGLNPTRAKNWQFDMFHIFPNFNLLLFRDSYIIHQFWPVTVDSSVWEISLNQPQAKTAAELFTQEQTKCVFREAVTEDGGTHEQTQEALESGAISVMQLKDEEIALRHSYVMLEKVIAEAEA